MILMISELESVIESMKEAAKGTSVSTFPVGDINSGSGESGSASGDFVDADEDEYDPTSNIIPNNLPVLENEHTDENIVNNEVIVVTPSDINPMESGRGGASYTHTCLLLLIISLLIQLM
jgi:hypothetical protein